MLKLELLLKILIKLIELSRAKFSLKKFSLVRRARLDKARWQGKHGVGRVAPPQFNFWPPTRWQEGCREGMPPGNWLVD
jgi:hypothetical protein